MASNALQDAQVAQAPTFLILAGSGANDDSGNGNNFTAQNGLTIGSGANLVDPVKNSSLVSTNFVGASSHYLSRTLPANTNSKLMQAAGGGEVECFLQSSDTTNNVDLLDTRTAGGANGIVIRFNGDSNAGEFTVYAFDSLGVYSQYKAIDASGYAFHHDGRKNRVIVQYVAKTANHGADAKGNEVCRLKVNRTWITLTDATPAGQRACRGAGVFSDHGGTIEIGKQRGASVYLTAKIQNLAWYPRFRTAAEHRAVWSAATYDIGDGVGTGLNGVGHWDASKDIFRLPDFSGQPLNFLDEVKTNNTAQCRVGSIPNQYDLYLGGSGNTGGIKNVNEDTTTPYYYITPNNKPSIYFDNFNQLNPALVRRQYLKADISGAYGEQRAGRMALTFYGKARTNGLIGVGTQHVMTLSRDLGDTVLGNNDTQALAYANGQPCAVSRGNTPAPTSGTTFPWVRCQLAPDMMCASFGEGGLTDIRLSNAGVCDSVNAAMSITFNDKSHLTVGCWQNGVNGFDGWMHEAIYDDPIDDEDKLIRRAFLDTKWGTVRTCHATVGVTSLETGNPASTEATETNDSSAGWVGKLTSALHSSCSCCVLAKGGSYSGILFADYAVTVSNGSWNNTTKVLTKAGAFTAYAAAFVAGLYDYIEFTSGTGAPASARITAATANTLTLQQLSGDAIDAGGNQTNWNSSNIKKGFSGNSSAPGTFQGFDAPGVYAANVPNLVLLEPYANDCLQAENPSNGNHANIASQSRANVDSIIAQARGAVLGLGGTTTVKFGLMMFSTDGAFGGNATGATGLSLTATPVNTPSDLAFTVTMNGLPSGVLIHPTGGLPNSDEITDDYQWIADLVSPRALAAFGGGGSPAGFRSMGMGIRI